MVANKARDTKPELAVRRLLHARGLRYRVNAKPEPDLQRTADVLFSRWKVAVFVDGCYWHGCPQHYRAPRTNAGFWEAKVTRNRERDAETTRLLEERGWSVLRFWAHLDPEHVAEVVEEAVRASAD